MSGRARSWLFTPAHSERLLARAFDAGADRVVLDLEDGVPTGDKVTARRLAAEVLAGRRAWVRISAPGSPGAAADLAAVGHLAAGIRVPKVDSPADLEWVRDHLNGREVPLGATIESAAGALAARTVAGFPGVQHLIFGAADFAADTASDPSLPEAALLARSLLVLASRAAAIDPPLDGAFTHLDDGAGLEAEAVRARRLGFGGKSCIHPRQVPVVNAAFDPTPEQVAWAESVIRVAGAGGAARAPGGEMVDPAVVRRARSILGDPG